MKNRIHRIYLDWLNNFLTVERFADHYNMSSEKATRVIQIGRKIHHKGCDQ